MGTGEPGTNARSLRRPGKRTWLAFCGILLCPEMASGSDGWGWRQALAVASPPREREACWNISGREKDWVQLTQALETALEKC
ncbi:hypothetical protein chiPu_0032908, partial [Chiloscyllium punctatum]|nr:hypothetical protein [Chiloscyllium punctatum]